MFARKSFLALIGVAALGVSGCVTTPVPQISVPAPAALPAQSAPAQPAAPRASAPATYTSAPAASQPSVQSTPVANTTPPANAQTGARQILIQNQVSREEEDNDRDEDGGWGG